MSLVLMPLLLINVLLLLLQTRSRGIGHAKNMERVIFLRIQSIFRSTVFALVLGRLQWYVAIFFFE
jgi:preprotein translocase subunit SecG